MIKFKVLDTSTGLFSHGGYNPRWGTRGKSWDTLDKAVDSVKSYLKYRKYCTLKTVPKYNFSGKKLPENIMIVEYQVILNELKRTSINDLIETEVQVCPIVKKIKKPKSKSQKKIGNKLKNSRKSKG